MEANDLRNAVSDVPGINFRSESQTLNTSSQKTYLKFLGPPGQYPSLIIFSSVNDEKCRSHPLQLYVNKYKSNLPAAKILEILNIGLQ
jgi:hypothetical protein